MIFFLFALGAAVGSFLGVVADRYRENLPIWDKKIIGGPLRSEASRSHCEFCAKKLRWFELVPIISFIVQKGRCRSCGHKLGIRYLYVEIITGFLFVFIPASLSKEFYILHSTFYILSVLWILVFSLLLLISLIDIRLRMIPDETNIALVFLGALITHFRQFGEFSGSFMGHYAVLFGWRSDQWINHFGAAIAAGLFFAALILATRGRGMGGGDMKLAAAMGFVFGWPDIVLVILLSFIIGSFFGIGAIALKKEKPKSRIAFGPFLALSGLLVFFCGYEITGFYFGMFAG